MHLKFSITTEEFRLCLNQKFDSNRSHLNLQQESAIQSLAHKSFSGHRLLNRRRAHIIHGGKTSASFFLFFFLRGGGGGGHVAHALEFPSILSALHEGDNDKLS